MKIKVTQKNIDEGLRGSCTKDPISLAMKDAGFHIPWVSTSGISFHGRFGRENYEEYQTPEEVLSFMVKFDNEIPVSPMEFELGE
jgi:hypothetical protein